ncbi:tyrosine-type recombinase/integrase [Erysipelothrix rhusiopathiae]|uniref:integrase n=1 Tax=Erysipelothrix phage SE-1 TaxID=1675317 RepID=UPI00065F36B5|nr:site-specific integrase [Erysipelothrix rhusiopathiae]YP_009224245.1 integrase [Erysipelothrix phage SE-1]AKQ06879.1 integrase [Erysipelothrix phage SE-1]MDV7685150.1 site-specific integrase [Erysipelothrix rhusiopathiae]
MGVYKNNITKKWEWVYRDKNGKQIRRKSIHWTTKAKAREHFESFLQEINKNDDNYVETVTLNHVVEEYLNNISLSKKKSTILRSQQTISRHILPYFGNTNIEHITVRDIQRWQNNLLKKRVRGKKDGPFFRNKYLENIQTQFKSVLNFARIYGYIETNPFEKIPIALRREYEEKKKMTILTKSQFDTFMRVVDNPIDYAIYSVLYWCGLRSGELLALKIKDYDKIKKTLHIRTNYDTKNRIITHTKNDHERIIKIPDVCVAALNRVLKEYPNTSEKYFLFGYHHVIPKSTLDNRKIAYWNKVNPEAAQEIEALGISRNSYEGHLNVPWFTFHELRHTHVSTLIDIGWEAKDIADRLGHSVHEVNETYGHLFPQRKDEMFQKLNDL